MEFKINDTISDYFEEIKNLSSFVSKSSEFSEPCSIEKLLSWENKNKIKIPDMYKSWLLLNESSFILGGYFELYLPEIIHKESDNVLIGSIVGDGEHLFFSKLSGEIFSMFEGEKQSYQGFDEFLSNILGKLEEEAENEYGENWLDIYNEQI